jgi:site-specific recombinase XerD
MSTDLVPAAGRPAPTPAPASGSVPAPHEYDDELLARLAALDEASDAHAAEQRPANTVRSYASDWRTWQTFCAGIDVPVTAATRGTLRAFVKWLWDVEHRAPSTIDRKLAGVAVTLRGPDFGVVVDPAATAAARQLLKDYQRQAAEQKEAPRGRGKAPALRVRALRQIVAACPDDLPGLRARAVVLIAFSIAGRRHEVAALTVRSMEEVEEGLRVDVRVSKTHPRVVPVPFGQNPDTCPVRAWRAWRDAAELTEPDSAAFREIHASGSVLGGLTPAGIGTVITAAGQRAGVKLRFTGHSARSGMATEARRAGKDRKAIAAITGHKPNSPVLDGYIQLADEFDETDNALFGIGL